MYKIALTCLLLACAAFYAVEGLQCVDGISGSIPGITANPSKPGTACTGRNQRCARLEASVRLVKGIQGVFMKCVNQTSCESLKNVATCEKAAIGFLSPTKAKLLTGKSCKTACCMTDNCNSKSIAEIKAMTTAAPTRAPTMSTTSGTNIADVSITVLLLSVFANLLA